MNSTVRALPVSGSDLYAGGEFTTAGGKVSAVVGKVGGSAWYSNKTRGQRAQRQPEAAAGTGIPARCPKAR